ncbi:DUF302 domain-containing protein [Candidatus Neomarinimicrobiota bacterium]
MSYCNLKIVNGSFESIEIKIRDSLLEQGFGIITEIDVKETFKKKLDIDFQKYKILGACNPPIAHKLLNADQLIGLLLPCNVVLWDNDDGTVTVAAIDATKMLTITERSDFNESANEVNELLKQALESI